MLTDSNEIKLHKNLDINLSVYHCGQEKCKNGHSFGPAVRDHYLIHYIVDGEGEYTHNNVVYKLGAGDGFLISPSEVTYYKASNENPWTYYWVGFNGSDALTLLLDIGISSENVVFHYKNGNKLEKCLSDLTTASKQSGVMTKQYSMLGHLYLILAALMENSDHTPKHNISDIYLEKFISFVHNNYSYDISIHQIAHDIGVDRSHLFKLFKKKYNISLQKYVIQYRLLKSCHLLENTPLGISEIASSVGFKDSAHYCHSFKIYYGVSPRSYRKRVVELTRPFCDRL